MNFFKSERLKSSNFIVNIAGLVLSFIGAATAVPMVLDVDTTVTAVIEQNWGYIVGTALPILVNYASRVIEKIKAGLFSVQQAFRDTNTWMAIITLVAFILSGIGIILPDDAPQAIIDAIEVGSSSAIFTAIAVYIINPIWHAIFDKDEPEAITE